MYCHFCVCCVCVCVVIPFILDIHPTIIVDAPAGVTQEEGHTGFLIHLPSGVLTLIATEEATVTQQLSDRCIKWQSSSWTQEVRRSTGHIMVTTRYSDQQGSKSRQNPCLARSNQPRTSETCRRQDDVFGVLATVSTVWIAASSS